MFVLTIDQRGSRHGTDLVPDLLDRLRAHPGVLLGFDRTVGDEVQGVVEDAAIAVEITLDVMRTHAWSVGLGPAQSTYAAARTDGVS